MQCVGKGYAPSFFCRPVRHDPSVPLLPLIRRTDSNFTQPYPLLPCCPVGLVSPYACLLSCLQHTRAARHAARQCAVSDDVAVWHCNLQTEVCLCPLFSSIILSFFPFRCVSIVSLCEGLKLTVCFHHHFFYASLCRTTRPLSTCHELSRHRPHPTTHLQLLVERSLFQTNMYPSRLQWLRSSAWSSLTLFGFTCFC